MAFEIKQYEDIVNDIVQRLLTTNTNLSDLNQSSIIRMLIETYSLELESEEFQGLYQQIRNVYEATRISTAEGEDLDEIGKLVGVTRRQGSNATCVVSMMRVSQSFDDFTIAAGNVVSTQPDGETEPLRFSVVSDTTFKGTITDEEHLYIDGIYNYRLNQRFYDSISNAKGYIGGVLTNLTKDVKWQEFKEFSGAIVEPTSIEVFDNCNATTDWINSADADAPVIDTVNKRQGTASLSLGKSGTTTASASYQKTLTAGLDLTNKTPNLKFRIGSPAALAAINKIVIHIGDSNINYLIFTLNQIDLVEGWNDFFLNTATSVSQGTPQIGNMKYFKIDIQTVTTGTTILNTDLNMDFIIFGTVENYFGDILQIIDDGAKPDNNTLMKLTYIPLSVEVICQAENIGVSYNVASGKLTYKVSALPNIVSIYNYPEATGGEDIETDDSLRGRITTSTSGLGKATADAIKTAVSSLSFVTSVNVVDMPLKNTTEVHQYFTGTLSYQLVHEVAQQNTNLILTVNKTSLGETLTDVDTTITVGSALLLPLSGYIKLDSEIIFYNGKAGNDLQNCIRGSEGTTAASHSSGIDCYQWFKPGTDFTIDTESKVQWTGSGNLPLNNDLMTIYYEYRWLAHINVFVSGPYTFTTPQNDEIIGKIEETKAAGIAYAYLTPVVTNVNVNASVKLLPGYSFASIQAAAVEALTAKLNSYDIAESIYLSQLIDVIMSIEGVNYTTIASPSGTVVIAESEIAKAGTIIINQI
jgi:uncharacterized phage protein gp47/JayE